MTNDRLALYAVFGILFLRTIIEIKRACAYGPKQASTPQADARTRFSILSVLKFRWDAKGVGRGQWKEEALRLRRVDSHPGRSVFESCSSHLSVYAFFYQQLPTR